MLLLGAEAESTLQSPTDANLIKYLNVWEFNFEKLHTYM